MNQIEAERFLEAIGTSSIEKIAWQFMDSIDCDDCGLKDRCELLKEIRYIDENNLDINPITGCQSTIEHYILTGEILDEKKGGKYV